MRERHLLGLTAVPFVVAALLPGALLGGDEVTAFEDPAIVESSGLAIVGGELVTTNDSGDSGRLFSVDPGTGATTRVTEWSPDPEDVEALAPAGDGAVWVGDIGDNRADRDSVAVTRVGVGGAESVGPTYRLVYPGGPRDAESLLADPSTDRLYVVSKGVFGGVVYAAPRRLSPDHDNRLEEVGPAIAVATDAAFFPDGRHVIVRNYTEAAVYTWPDLALVGTFDLPHQQQGEGIAVADDGTIYLSSEGLHAPVLSVPLPPDVREAMAPTSSASPTAPTTSASPSASPLPDDASAPSTSTEEPARRSVWGWALGGVVGLGIVLVLVRSLRPR